jgi:hypothetical protein
MLRAGVESPPQFTRPKEIVPDRDDIVRFAIGDRLPEQREARRLMPPAPACPDPGWQSTVAVAAWYEIGGPRWSAESEARPLPVPGRIRGQVRALVRDGLVTRADAARLLLALRGSRDGHQVEGDTRTGEMRGPRYDSVEKQTGLFEDRGRHEINGRTFRWRTQHAEDGAVFDHAAAEAVEDDSHGRWITDRNVRRIGVVDEAALDKALGLHPDPTRDGRPHGVSILPGRVVIAPQPGTPMELVRWIAAAGAGRPKPVPIAPGVDHRRPYRRPVQPEPPLVIPAHGPHLLTQLEQVEALARRMEHVTTFLTAGPREFRGRGLGSDLCWIGMTWTGGNWRMPARAALRVAEPEDMTLTRDADGDLVAEASDDAPDPRQPDKRPAALDTLHTDRTAFDWQLVIEPILPRLTDQQAAVLEGKLLDLGGTAVARAKALGYVGNSPGQWIGKREDEAWEAAVRELAHEHLPGRFIVQTRRGPDRIDYVQAEAALRDLFGEAMPTLKRRPKATRAA